MFFSLNQLALRNSTRSDEAGVAQPAGRLFDRVAVLRAGEEPAWVLEQDRAELAGYPQRLESFDEPRPDLVAKVVGQVLGVDPRLGGQVVGEGGAQVLRQALRLGRLAGHQRVGLDVEGEVRRRARDPQLGGPRGRQRVVGGVDLDDREPAGVVAEALLGRVGAVGIEDAPGRHRRVGPRRGPDADRATGRGCQRLGGDVLGQRLDPSCGRARAGIVNDVQVGGRGLLELGRRRALRTHRVSLPRSCHEGTSASPAIEVDAIPYYGWANRVPGAMRVGIPQGLAEP